MNTVGIMEKLPVPKAKGTMTLEEALMQRESVRNFKSQELNRDQISQLLWAAQGINRKDQQKRTCPSAGATYPLETYAVTPDGFYHYNVSEHSLELVRQGDLRKELAGAALGQASIAKAPLSIVFCAVYSRTTVRYKERGIMYVHMEAGHAAQNVHLQAAALGLGAVSVGAFEENRVSDLLGCGESVPIYIIPVGYPE